MKKIVSLGVLFAGSVLWAIDGKTITTREGVCQMAVRPNWVIGSISSMAGSLDKKVSAIMAVPKMADSFAEAKQTAKSVYKNSKVKDSATEFEMEGKSITDTPDVCRLIPAAGSKVCMAEVQYHNGTVDDVRKIAETVKSAK